ncbi:hypothetical protein SAMN04515671_4443 [Nakamurella panacisegetis]|uniref:TIGR01777 family protein n=1 Tax=Nakamurella panacisegetis TaxID=1090615 RepID=A0A1H0T337_9ACTN|nr:TIGR01777 family oxidoreductase [Nakamurella panacisegetis]SDP48463.1 hypothetical protein SAMN04515671_4443 [Nakamurella panacisegetis]
MHIIAAGASGFLGQRLIGKLTADGHRVTQLVRRAPTGANQVTWDPDRGELDAADLQGVDGIVNLCGVGVGDKRWSVAYRDLIRSSRVNPTTLLASRAAQADVPVMLSASGVGYYGPRGNEEIDETAHAGTSFLAGVCVDWERATEAAETAGVRVAHLRTGLVLGKEAGLLPKLALLTKLFAGGRLGSGRQYYPWISATDHIDAMVHLLTTEVSGPVNVCGPAPVTNAEFAKELGRQLHRPTPWMVPKFALQIAVGDFAEEIVNGQRAIPKALLDSGFGFTHPTLTAALQAELG